MTEYKAGTVAKATVRGVPDVTVMHKADGYWSVSVGGGVVETADLCDLRPLVVLDLGTDEANELADYLQGVDMHLSVGDRARIARQIRQQAKPPRIPEPSIYGVVEAGHPQKDGKRSNFVRIIDEGDRRHWVDETYEADLSEWDDLIDPVLVREGV